MKQKTIIILGGYGNAGIEIARLLARQQQTNIILAGRNGKQAQQAAEDLNNEYSFNCVRGVEADASNRISLLKAFQNVDIVLVAASTIEFAPIIIDAALESNIDYFDIQISTPEKHQMLEMFRKQITMSNRIFITDGGYRPGIPAAMVRYAATQIPELTSASVSSVFQVNWKKRQLSFSTCMEFVDEFKYFNQKYFKDGVWTQGNMRDFSAVDFGTQFGTKYCMPMYLEEFHSLPELIPSLKNTGFYSAGFGGLMDFVIIPITFALLKVFPDRSDKLAARILEWGMRNTSRPPYGAVLTMRAKSISQQLTMTVFHEDPYIITAAPTVACLLQYFDGTFNQPGLWHQGTLVEPIRFFEDLKTFGMQISIHAPTHRGYLL